jgi:hypothetical protein
VKSTTDLLILRAQQLLRRDEDLAEAALHLQRKRQEGKEAFDAGKRLRTDLLDEEAIVLLHDAVREVDMSKRSKLAYRWLGPYRVRKAYQDKGTYLLEELDGTQLAGTFAGNRLKRFIQRDGFMVSADDMSELPDLPAAGENHGHLENTNTGTDHLPVSQGTANHLRGDERSAGQSLQSLIPAGKNLAVVI